jgi:hypothetical protein
MRRLALEIAALPGREAFDATEFIRRDRDRDGRLADIVDAVAESKEQS